MAWNREIIWSQESLRNLDDIIDYLRDHWTEKEVLKFKFLLSRRLKVISSFPGLYPRSAQNKALLKSVVTRQTSIIYQVKEDTIYIVYLFDNRMNPSKLR